MKFAAVTPVRNGGELIASTVASIVGQSGLDSGDVELDYLVWDGASSDDTRARALAALDGRGRIVTQRDTGMYDALARGFGMVDGDFCFYLNAGDTLQPGALRNVAALVRDHGSQWLCGLQTYYSRNGSIVGTKLPPRFVNGYIRSGLYGRLLPSIQQESTFWSRTLLEGVDLDTLANFKLAGDAYLWAEFAKKAELDIFQVSLSGFRYHGDHLSSQRAEYEREMLAFAGELSLFDRARAAKERVLWHAPRRALRRLSGRPHSYASQTDRWSQ